MDLVMVSKEDGVETSVTAHGTTRRIVDYFGRTSGKTTGTDAFLVEAHNRTVRAHFHSVDQYQLLLGEPGSLFQRTPVSSLMVHYADAYSTYGPLVGATPPLRFFTLRATSNPSGTWYMPEDRAELPYRGKRHFLVDVEQKMRETSLPNSGAQFDSLYGSDHGLQSLLVSVAPDSVFEVSSSTGSSGQYLVVAEGEARWDGVSYPTHSIGWQSSVSPPAELTAGSSGCRVLVLRFPSPSTPTAHSPPVRS